MTGVRKLSSELITALYADENGEIFDAPGIAAVGRLGDEIRPLTVDERPYSRTTSRAG